MRPVLLVLILALIAPMSVKAIGQKDEELQIVVYRSPSCGCCGKWIRHLKENRFVIKDVVTDDVQQIKRQYGVPDKLASCHTAIIDGKVVEGHVPASDIKRLLKLDSGQIGISVPGMPAGTPGMEMGGRKDPYQVISFDKEGNISVFQDYP